MMTNGDITKAISDIIGLLDAKVDPTTAADNQQKVAMAGISLLANALQNLNDVARYCRANTPAGSI